VRATYNRVQGYGVWRCLEIITTYLQGNLQIYTKNNYRKLRRACVISANSSPNLMILGPIMISIYFTTDLTALIGKGHTVLHSNNISVLTLPGRASLTSSNSPCFSMILVLFSI
jgi:hypothetical protein